MAPQVLGENAGFVFAVREKWLHERSSPSKPQILGLKPQLLAFLRERVSSSELLRLLTGLALELNLNFRVFGTMLLQVKSTTPSLGPLSY